MNKFYEIPPVPKEAFRLSWSDARAAYYVSEPRIGDTDVFTREQIEDHGFNVGKAVHNQAVQGFIDALNVLGEKSPTLRLVFKAIADQLEEKKVTDD